MNVKKNMANETHPDCNYDSSIKGFRIRGFDPIDKRTEVGIEFRGKLNNNISGWQYKI
jgi:hypothetical protein